MSECMCVRRWDDGVRVHACNISHTFLKPTTITGVPASGVHLTTTNPFTLSEPTATTIVNETPNLRPLSAMEPPAWLDGGSQEIFHSESSGPAYLWSLSCGAHSADDGSRSSVISSSSTPSTSPTDLCRRAVNLSIHCCLRP